MSTEHLKACLTDQFAASLAMLRDAVQKCPDDAWEQPVGTQPFWMVAYHAAFYTDLYLTPHLHQYTGEPAWAWKYAAGLGRMMEPPFDPLTPEQIGPVLERRRVLEYLDAIAEKLHRIIPAETDETLAGGSGFFWYPIPRLSMHLNNIRHVQHHAGQLSAVLRKHGVDVAWLQKQPVGG